MYKIATDKELLTWLQALDQHLPVSRVMQNSLLNAKAIQLMTPDCPGFKVVRYSGSNVI